MGIIEVEGLCKSFGDLSVLQNVNLSVNEGERISIIGGSGCGKSVFLRCLNLLEIPDKGRVLIDGKEITAPGADVDNIRRSMGMVFQKFCLFSHMNVIDNLCLAPTRLLGMSREDAENKAHGLLKEVGLVSKREAMPLTLSGGQQQRIAICRALMMEPRVLLLDEPTSALDPTMVGEVLAVIRLLAKKNLTFLIVTHEMSFAREVSDRILYFADRGIYESGTPEEVFDHPKREKTIAFINKYRYYGCEISDKNEFDLMSVQGGIWTFGERYGLSDKRILNLQLCTEELIYEFMDVCYPEQNKVDIKLDITFAETTGKVHIEFVCGGKPYNPVTVDKAGDDFSDSLGVIIVKKISSDIGYEYAGDKNRVWIEL
ncbi:MAG TPA: amino acid ABC transporter ATP-binding protein [Selenomonas sp.]|nr:amino acid ABC transporter ATP-binding protein [Selenomonas sp.]